METINAILTELEIALQSNRHYLNYVHLKKKISADRSLYEQINHWKEKRFTYEIGREQGASSVEETENEIALTYFHLCMNPDVMEFFICEDELLNILEEIESRVGNMFPVDISFMDHMGME